MEKCLQAVISGVADYTSFNNFVIDHYTYLRGNNKIVLTAFPENSTGICIGLARPADPALLTILDKTILNIPSQFTQSLVYKNTTNENAHVTLTNLIYSNPIGFTAFVASLCVALVMIVLFLLFVTRTRLKMARQNALNNESYRIIGELTDEYIYHVDFQAQTLLLPKPFAHLTGCKDQWSKKEIISGDNQLLKTLYRVVEECSPGTQRTVEFEHTRPDGSEIWFKADATAVCDSGGRPVHGIGKIKSIQDEVREKQRLENKANTDALTGLYNRQYCEKLIIDYFSAPGQNPKAGALMVMDLDHFKAVNDTLGHLAGDAVLRELSQTLTRQFSSEALIARWGGDEFMVFIPNAKDRNEIARQAETLCTSMNRTFSFDQKDYMISISIGIALCETASTYKELFKKADEALYIVKRGARNGYKMAD